VALVNRDRDRNLPVTLDLAGATIVGAVSAWEVNGPTCRRPTRSRRRARWTSASASWRRALRLETVLPAHSVTVLRFDVR